MCSFFVGSGWSSVSDAVGAFLFLFLAALLPIRTCLMHACILLLRLFISLGPSFSCSILIYSSKALMKKTSKALRLLLSTTNFRRQ